jgi:hypothetical protein
VDKSVQQGGTENTVHSKDPVRFVSVLPNPPTKVNGPIAVGAFHMHARRVLHAAIMRQVPSGPRHDGLQCFHMIYSADR